MQVSFSIQAIIQQKLSEYLANVHSIHFNAVGGGSINECYRISFGKETVFCKINSATKFPRLFLKERSGLETLAAQNCLQTPSIIDCFEAGGKQFLLLQWIEQGERTEQFWKTFGEQLAALHRITNNAFGLYEDNYMGSVVQSNKQHKDWGHFFWHERLLPIMKRCEAKNLLHKNHLHQFEAVQKKLPIIFEAEKPSLLHGDLWSGNFMCNATAEPVLIDPAIYFGHRSVDLAMTTLFGGFRQSFYEAYHYYFPLPSNYEEQWAMCNLYPLLIHLYLFGSGYLMQIERTLKQFA